VYRRAFAGILAQGVTEHLSNQQREMWFQSAARAARAALDLARLKDETLPASGITRYLPMREINALYSTPAELLQEVQ